MEEQLLKDFIATAQQYNYDYDVVMPKFPELANVDLQILKDYIATAESNNYDYDLVNSKFPELEIGVKKKGISEPVGDTEGTTASSTEQAPASPFFLDSQSSDPIAERGIGFEEPVASEEEIELQKPSTFDPSTFVMPEENLVGDQYPGDTRTINAAPTEEISEFQKPSTPTAEDLKPVYEAPLVQDSRDDVSKTGVVDIAFNAYDDTLYQAIESGLVKDEEEFRKKFPDMNSLTFEKGQADLSFKNKYDNLSDEIKKKIEPAIIKEDGVIIGVNPDLISKETLKFLEETALDDDMTGESSEGQAQTVIKAILPKQKIDYLINEKKLNNIVEGLVATRKEIARLITIGLPEQARDLRDNDYNPNYEEYKSLSKNLNDTSILINSLDIVKDNTGMWAPVSTLTSAVETFGSSVITALPTLAASAMHLSANLPGMPKGASEVSSKYEKDIMDFGMDLKKEWEELVPTDNDDSIGNFIGNVTGQVAFIVGSASLGGMPAAAAAGYTMSASEMYSEAMASGLSHDDAMYLSMVYGTVSAPLEMAGAGKLIKKATGITVRKKIIQAALKNGVAGFTKEIADKAVKASFKPIIIETLKEGAEEGLQEGTQYLISKGLAESYNNFMREDEDAEFKKTKMLREEGDAGFAGITKAFWGELGQNLILGTAGGFIGGSSINIMQGNVYVGSNYKFIENMLLDPKQMSKINDQLTAYRNDGTIKTDEELQVIKERVGIIQEAAAQVDRATKASPESFGIEQQKKTFALVAEKMSAEKEIEGMMPILAETKKAEIEIIDNKIRDIASGKITEAQLIEERAPSPVVEEAVAESAPVVEEAVAEEVEQIALEEPSESQLQDDVKNGEVVTLKFENENDIPDVYKNKTKVKNPILITGTIQVGRRGKAKPTIMVKVEKSLVDYYESTKQVAEEVTLSKKVDAVFAEKNPDKVEVLSGNLARNKSSKFKPSEITQKYIGQATRAAKAIQKIAPKVRVVLHDTTEEYSSFGKKGSRGMYDPVSKTVHIDLSKANKNTIGHEMFHSILFNTIGTEKDIQAATDDMYKSVKRSLATNPIMKRKLRKFSENYGENIQSEEALSELFGMLSSEYKQLNAPTKVKIKQFINKIASKFGLTDIINLSEQDLSDLETIELLNTMAARVKEGESILESEPYIAGLITKEQKNKKDERKTTTKVQSKRTGDGGGRVSSRKLTPLEGSPSVPGINGSDPQIVAVAEKYAADNGIDLKRQSEYVKVDEDRAKRIADAYDQMADDPKNPKVKEAYQELIKQTMDQYQALVDAGYTFWFMDLNIPSNEEYAASPYNAMRDMRNNKQMGVFPTTDGYGDGGLSELDVESNPLLADTGLQWAVGGVDGPMKPVLANDLFRAVHDAFGHGLEGSGFRARGEENAWQAHARLFTGPAIAALTSETRGQNSWVNFGPNGETNRTASVEDTVFAPQKIGLMPEFTWEEGLAGDMQEDIETLTEIQEQGEGGDVGTIRVPREQIEVIDSPNAKNDPRPWVRDILEMLDLVGIEGTKFITNMYDYTNAGTTDLGNGYSIELLGGRNYVPLIMERMGRKIGDISNLAAFNNKTQAETFIRNSIEGEANMFAPHSGTLDGSWQFQQHIFEELVNLVLDKNILTNEDIIKSFNAGLIRTPKALETALAQYKKDLKSFNKKGFYKDGKQKIEEKPIEPTKIIEPFAKFLKRYNEDKSLPKLKNKESLNDFINNPKELVRLLDIENNFSPDLRKRLNQKIASNKKFQKAIGVNNLGEFHQRIIDPLNKGVVGGEIMTLVKFDPSTFEIVKTKPGALDHHPSFGWAVKAKIENIYQPTKFFKSYDITEEYTKFNIDGPSVSRKADVGEAKFKQSNVSSSAGAIPKNATISSAVREQKEKKVYKNSAFFYGGFFTGVQRQGFGKSIISDIFKTNPQIENILLYTQDDAIGFWKKAGGTVVQQGKDTNGILRYFVQINKNDVDTSLSTKKLGVSYKNLETKKSKIAKGEYAIKMGRQKIGFFFVRDVGTIKTNPMGMIIEDVATPATREQKEDTTTISKILAKITDITKIDLKEQIDIAKSLKQIVKLTAKEKKILNDSLNDTLKELQDKNKGKITLNQVNNVIKKFNNVDAFSQAQVDDFVDYMTKVFADADYVSKISKAKSSLPKARKGAKRKIGAGKDLGPLLDKLLGVDPKKIPSEVLDKYLDLVDILSKRDKELTLPEAEEIMKDASDIINVMDSEIKAIYWLGSGFQDYIAENKSNVKGKSFSEILQMMKEEGIINEEEVKLMKKYKSSIAPQEGQAKKTDEEIQKEKDELIIEARDMSKKDTRIFSDQENSLVKELKKLIKSNAMKGLSLSDLKTLLKVVDNINNGFVTNIAHQLRNKLNGDVDGNNIVKPISKSTIKTISKKYNEFKTAVGEKLGEKKNYVQKKLESSPLYYIDLILGNGKSTEIFDSLFRKLATAEERFNYDNKKISKKIEIAQQAVLKSLKRSDNALRKSSAKQMLFLLQLEYNSNSDKNKVEKALDYLEKTLELDSLGDRDKEMLREIEKEFTANGELDIDALYESFNKAEKQSIKTIQEINSGLTEIAMYTAGVIRGERVNSIINYVHHVVVKDDFNGIDIESKESLAERTKNLAKGSTKSKSLIERQSGARALNFDIYNSAIRGSKGTLLDYHLTEPIQTARISLKVAKDKLKEDGDWQDKKDIYEGVEGIASSAIETLILNNTSPTTTVDKVMSRIVKVGYQRMLTSTERFTAELLSNFAFISTKAGVEWGMGLKYAFISDEIMGDAMRNAGSLVLSRMILDGGIKSRFVDTLSNTSPGVSGKKIRSKGVDLVKQIHSGSTAIAINAVDKLADTVISTPDQITIRPLWRGSFVRTFQAETGKKFPADAFEKMAANDQAFMSEYEDAIAKATKKADDMTIEAGASSGILTGIFRGKDKKVADSSFTYKAFENFNSFMSTFMGFEYAAFKKGLHAAMGDGTISRVDGARLMVAVTLRMTMYPFIGTMTSYGIVGLLTGQDEEDDDEGLDKKLMRSVVQTGIALTIGRGYGNATKALQNLLIEEINENYLGMLRDGDYDKYQNYLSYTIQAKKKKYEPYEMQQYIEPLSGAFAPMIGSVNSLNVFLEDPKTRKDAIERQEKKRVKAIVDFASMFGVVPLASEVNKSMNKWIYKDMKEGSKSGGSGFGKSSFGKDGFGKSNFGSGFGKSSFK